MMKSLLRRWRSRYHPSYCMLLIMANMLAGCAANIGDQNDPYERTNRAIFSFNNDIDTAIARPVAVFYNHAIPEPARNGIHNALGNLDAPVTFGNAALQGEGQVAGLTLVRFVINSSVGVGGLVDVAARNGMPRDKEDFGITLGVWGVGEGPYLVLPLLGPSNPRDITGEVVDIFMDPLTYMKWKNSSLYMVVRAGLGVVDLRARNVVEVDQIERTSIDFYATTRNLYHQYREGKIHHGEPEIIDLPNF